jgi:hypothetical protein
MSGKKMVAGCDCFKMLAFGLIDMTSLKASKKNNRNWILYVE